MITIAIDCGASFIKGAAFLDGVLIKKESAAAPAVHEADDIFVIQQIDAVIACVRNMIERLAGREKSVKLVLSSEMHGFILANADGSAYTDYLSWQKELGRLEIDGISSAELLAESVDGETVKCSGMPLRAGLPSSNLFYLKRAGNLKQGLHFYTLGDYILRVLSGKEPVCHRTNAAASGLYDLRNNDWNWKYIRQVAGEGMVFPEIGEAPLHFVLDSYEITALPAIGDQQAALLGAGFSGDDSISFNLGTGAQVSVLTKELDFRNDYQIRPYFYGYYLKTIPHIPSGRALNVFFRFIKSILALWGIAEDDEACWRHLISAVQAAEETGMNCDLSFFENAVTADVKGSITQIGETDFTVGNLFKSVLKTMSNNYLTVADRLVPYPVNIKTVVLSGGIANRFDIIREKISNHYPGAKVIRVENETLLGLQRYGEICGRRCDRDGMS